MRQATRIVRDDPRSDNAYAGDLADNTPGDRLCVSRSESHAPVDARCDVSVNSRGLW